MSYIPSDRYLGSPSIWQMANGSLVASHDFFGKSTVGDTVQVFVDHSGQGTGLESHWRETGNVSAMYWANLFTPPGRMAESGSLFLMGVSSGTPGVPRSIVLSLSKDYGASWTVPSVLFPASANASYHTAPTPLLEGADGRLYRAFEMSVPGTHSQALVIRTVSPLSAATTAEELLDPTAWERSSGLPFDPNTMVPPDWDRPPSRFTWEEGNAVEGPRGGFTTSFASTDRQTVPTTRRRSWSSWLLRAAAVAVVVSLAA